MCLENIRYLLAYNHTMRMRTSSPARSDLTMVTELSQIGHACNGQYQIKGCIKAD